ncbi:MAG TPA: cytochrome c peroxidase [Polyangiaceae bacterium]|nr:cytochrome c peroxidase [Polyangiaceae bacterium]
MSCIRCVYVALLFGGSFGVGVSGCEPQASEQLGQRLFEDLNLSANRDQSCATCHSRDTGGTGAESSLNALGGVYEGSVKGRFGNRKPPASAYATRAPRFMHDAVKGFTGGNFWDGRATGWKLGSPAADQAQGPFLNPVEQAVPSVAELVKRVCEGEYGALFRQVWGASACDNDDNAYASIALSIADFEDARETNQFSSKYDLAVNGKAALTSIEARGLELFKGQAKCSNCHALDDSGHGPLFTDFGFDNLGIPINPENPFYGMDQVLIDGQPINPLGSKWVDTGLAGFLEQLAEDSGWRALPYVTPSLLEMSSEALLTLAPLNRGKHKVPTLRNVDKRPEPGFVKAYGHNGYFKSLQGIVHFYNTRDVLPTCPSAVTESQALANNCWPVPEVSDNLGKEDIGDLKLTAADEDALVAFLGTLSDGWLAQKQH